MTIALASRGYLCRRGDVVIVRVGDGPDIVSQRTVAPTISGSSVQQEEGPTISGTATPGPSISGGGQQVSQDPVAPSISGGNKPKIG